MAALARIRSLSNLIIDLLPLSRFSQARSFSQTTSLSMRKELQSRLYADFPNLFQHASLPNTTMSWGIAIGDGWEAIMRKLCERITIIQKGQTQTGLGSTSPAPAEYVFAQVKEKYGGLRVYMHGHTDPAVEEAIEEAEKEAWETCEQCGKAGELLQTKSGWEFTACQQCASERST